MTVKTLLAALVLSAAPAFAFAMCSGSTHASEQGMTCSDGATWDAESQTCVPTTTS